MDLKTRLHAHLLQAIEARQFALKQQRNQISLESTESGKGSAGDKHEVGIAMAQIEIEKLDQQIAIAQQHLSILQKLDAKSLSNRVMHGSLFKIDGNWYYSSVAQGQIKLDDTTFFCLSPEAPLFLALKGKQVHEEAIFNNKIWQIQQIL